MDEAEEEVSLDRRFVEPIGYLDVHVTPSDYRILPVVARMREGFSVRFGCDEVNDAFEVPLAFLMAPQNHRREKAGLERLDHERLCHLVQRPEDLGRDRRYTP